MAIRKTSLPRLVSDTTSGDTKKSPFSVVSGSEADLRDLFRKLWRRKMILIGTVFVILTATTIILNQLTPRYTSVAQVMIDLRQNKLVDIQAVLSGR